MSSDKLLREQDVLGAMITLYCRGNAHAEPVCPKCSVHCYQRDRRAKIREVMRYSGPRMILHHPMDALRHFLSR